MLIVVAFIVVVGEMMEVIGNDCGSDNIDDGGDWVVGEICCARER